jgi:chitinase
MMRRRLLGTLRTATPPARATLALTVAALALGAAAAATVPASAATTVKPAAAGVFAPYTDMSNSQESLLDTAITSHGVKNYTAAFVIGSGCNDIWGDTLPVGADSYTDPLIAKAKSEGANVIISSGGAAGEPLAWTCTDQASINAGYQKILDSYGVNSLDFDIEGAAIADTASVARQMQAMKSIQDANPGFTFSVTLPVLPTGLTSDGVNIIQAAKTAGVKIGVVNIMAMDYYSGSPEMGQAAISAAQATLAQMQAVDSSYTYANVGITPMIGTNDDGSTFTLADASTVESWAASNGIGRLSFWSINRDTSCSSSSGAAGIHPDASSTCSGVSQNQLAFSDAFAAF